MVGFLDEGAIASRDEELQEGAEEPPRSNLLVAVDGGHIGGDAGRSAHSPVAGGHGVVVGMVELWERRWWVGGFMGFAEYIG